jgi:hypothetical protein
MGDYHLPYSNSVALESLVFGGMIPVQINAHKVEVNVCFQRIIAPRYHYNTSKNVCASTL